MLFRRDPSEAVNLVDREPQRVAKLRDAAHRMLLGRFGFHLVAVGDGVARAFEGVAAGEAPIDRASIRHHDPDHFVDADVVRDPAIDLLRAAQPPLEDEMELGPGEERRHRVEVPAGAAAAGDPVALTAGFRFSRDNPDGAAVELTYRAPGITKSWTIASGRDETWRARDCVAVAGREAYFELRNPSPVPVRVRDPFLARTPAGAESWSVEGGRLAFAFRLARGTVDLNWDVERITALEIEMAGAEDVVPFVWTGDRFVRREWPLRLSPEEVEAARPPSRDALLDGLARLPRGAPAACLYRFGTPWNSRSEGAEDLAPDAETVARLNALGYR
jgi:hypothetical protein